MIKRIVVLTARALMAQKSISLTNNFLKNLRYTSTRNLTFDTALIMTGSDLIVLR